MRGLEPFRGLHLACALGIPDIVQQLAHTPRLGFATTRTRVFAGLVAHLRRVPPPLDARWRIGRARSVGTDVFVGLHDVARPTSTKLAVNWRLGDPGRTDGIADRKFSLGSLPVVNRVGWTTTPRREAHSTRSRALVLGAPAPLEFVRWALAERRTRAWFDSTRRGAVQNVRWRLAPRSTEESRWTTRS
jgi:hypothetical protein